MVWVAGLGDAEGHVRRVDDVAPVAANHDRGSLRSALALLVPAQRESVASNSKTPPVQERVLIFQNFSINLMNFHTFHWKRAGGDAGQGTGKEWMGRGAGGRRWREAMGSQVKREQTVT